MTDNPIATLITPKPRDIGGFIVRRSLPTAEVRSVGPFVFFDHMGPAAFGPGQGIDVRPHPHIGLATVTWLYDGALDHRDSLGTFQTIRPGAVNWMTAGRGISHSERTPAAERAAGHRIEGIQTWVALPVSHEDQEPDFAHYPADSLPQLSLPGLDGSLIAGAAFGERSPVRFPSGICQLTLTATSDAAFETPEMDECCVYVVSGAARIGGQPLAEAQMAVLKRGTRAQVEVAAGSRVMVAGGDRLEAPRRMDWNFVASSKEKIDHAVAQWRASIAAGFRNSWFTQPPGETSWIPYPGDPQPQPPDTPPSGGGASSEEVAAQSARDVRYP
jgi:redox-sensitive bicupin YhaK (pirin superfamily)